MKRKPKFSIGDTVKYSDEYKTMYKNSLPWANMSYKVISVNKHFLFKATYSIQFIDNAGNTINVIKMHEKNLILV